MSHGIIYLLTGRAHAARLVVSLWSLRRYYDGPVIVYSTHPESHVIGQRCAAERRLRVEHRRAEYVDTPRNGSFLSKVKLLPSVPLDVGIYLDADTLVAGDLSAMFALSPAEEFGATQFSNWTSSGRRLQKRIASWRPLVGRPGVPPRLAECIDETRRPWPAVNGGVFAFRPQASILEPWRDLAWAGRGTFICDEIALQLLLPFYPHKVFDCRYNCSPLYGVRRDDARIWHLHGEKHVSRASYRELWLPLYRQCVAADVAGISTWTPAGDRRLARFLKTQPAELR